MSILSVVDKAFTPEGEDKEIKYSRVVVASETNPNLQVELKLPANELNLVRSILEIDGEI